MYLINMFLSDPASAAIYLLSMFLAMCVASSFHECAHAYVAYKLGDPTAKNMGRMSLDPLRHLDWVGVLLFLFCGIGWAKPVMVNSKNLKHFRRDDVLISLAGPFTNLILSFIFYGIYFAVLLIWPALAFNVWFSQLLGILISLNISFAIFNMLPIPPLDGFHVITSLFVKKKYAVVEFLQRYGMIILAVLIISDVIPTVMGYASSGILWLYSQFFGLFI